MGIVMELVNKMLELDLNCWNCDEPSVGICKQCQLPFCRSCWENHKIKHIREHTQKLARKRRVKQKEAARDEEIRQLFLSLGIKKVEMK